MGYYFLFLALAFGLVKAYCGKRSSAAATCSCNAILINIVRMLLCVAIAASVVLVKGTFALAFITPRLIVIALIGGISTSLFTLCWLLAVRTNAYMMVEVFVMGGTIIPLTLCAILYEEHIDMVQIIGILLILIAVYCLSTYQGIEKNTVSLRSFLLLLLCAVSSGISDFSQKLYVKEIKNADVSIFNLYTYFFAVIVLLIIYPVFRKKEKNKTGVHSPSTTIKPIFHYITIMSCCLFLNAYFKTTAAKHLDATLLYPLNQGCAVILSFLMSVIVFKEKITVKGVIGIVLSIIAMTLINVVASA